MYTTIYYIEKYYYFGIITLIIILMVVHYLFCENILNKINRLNFTRDLILNYYKSIKYIIIIDVIKFCKYILLYYLVYYILLYLLV